MRGAVLIPLFLRMEHGHRNHDTRSHFQLLESPLELASLDTVVLLERSLEQLVPYFTANLISCVLVSNASK